MQAVVCPVLPGCAGRRAGRVAWVESFSRRPGRRGKACRLSVPATWPAQGGRWKTVKWGLQRCQSWLSGGRPLMPPRAVRADRVQRGQRMQRRPRDSLSLRVLVAAVFPGSRNTWSVAFRLCCSMRLGACQEVCRIARPPASRAMPSQAMGLSFWPKKNHPPSDVPRMPKPPHMA